MPKRGLVIVFCGALLLGGCASLDQDKKYPLTGAAVGAASGAAVGIGLGEPLTGALIGGLVGGVGGLLYDEFWNEQE